MNGFLKIIKRRVKNKFDFMITIWDRIIHGYAVFIFKIDRESFQLYEWEIISSRLSSNPLTEVFIIH